MLTRLCIAAVVAASVALTACTTDPDRPSATSSLPAAETPSQELAALRPTSWSGVRVAGDRVAIVTDGRVVHAEQGIDGQTAQLTYTDVDHGNPVLWSTCCEPVTGSTRAREGFDAYGARVDRVADTVVLLGADGTVIVRHAGAEHAVGFAGIVDAAVVGDRIVGLRDFGQVPDPVGEEQAGLSLVHISSEADVTEVDTVSEQACALTRYGQDAVAVLQPDPGGPTGSLYCRGTRLTVLDAASGDERETLKLDEQAVHISSDDSGRWLIVTRRSGAVDWIGVDGTAGRLAASGYIRADW